jgi:hypothetical protein
MLLPHKLCLWLLSKWSFRSKRVPKQEFGNESNKEKTAMISQKWGLLLGLSVVILGLLLLWLNLPLQSFRREISSSPVTIREGLIVRGSGPDLYIFKRYRLHPLISPNPTQVAQAQPVSDSFLSQHSLGSPINAQGEPVPGLREDHLALPGATGGARTGPIPLLGILLGGVLVVVGGCWLTIQLSPGSPPAQQGQLEAYLQQTDRYIQGIEQILKSQPEARQQQLLNQTQQWRGVIEALVQRLACFQQNELIQQDFVAVPEAITTLERQLATPVRSPLQAHLAQALAQRQTQQVVLEQLRTTATQAEMQIELTLSLLGTLYSQLLTNQSSLQLADYSHWLREVDEQVQGLQDYLEALREVKLGLN